MSTINNIEIGISEEKGEGFTFSTNGHSEGGFETECEARLSAKLFLIRSAVKDVARRCGAFSKRPVKGFLTIQEAGQELAGL